MSWCLLKAWIEVKKLNRFENSIFGRSLTKTYQFKVDRLQIILATKNIYLRVATVHQ